MVPAALSRFEKPDVLVLWVCALAWALVLCIREGVAERSFEGVLEGVLEGERREQGESRARAGEVKGRWVGVDVWEQEV